MIHRLTEKDTEARRAVCSIDGPVAIRKAGNGYACSVKLNEQARKTKARNPGRKRSSDSPHRLTWKDPVSRTGTCPIDGAVTIVAWGGGWVCEKRAEELGHVNHQDAPQNYCRDCKTLDAVIVWLDVDGGCRRCQDNGLNNLYAETLYNRNERGIHRAGDDEGLSAADLAEVGIYEVFIGRADIMPEYESAVAGWKTLG